MPSLPEDTPPVVIARATGATGGELVLRRAGGHFEIISNGVFLMDTRDGRSERAMVRASLAAFPPRRRGLEVLIAGLGVGFSAREALDDPRVGRVRVIELEAMVIEWHSGPLAETAGDLLADPRCHVVRADFLDWLADATDAGGPTFDAVCLDIDNGPTWTVVEANARLYQPAALDALDRLLRPDGAIAVWSALRAPAFAESLERRFGSVRTLEIPAARGDPDVVYVARRAEGT